MRVVFGVLPIGTGNDFATSLGYHSASFKHPDENTLAKFAARVVKGDVGKYDVWDCRVSVQEGGHIVEIKEGIERKI